jgi:hypothetical protein
MSENKKAASSRVAARMGRETASSIKQSQFTSSRSYKQVPPDNSAASQRNRILYHLRHAGPLTTLQARHQLDCMHPGMRICELRKSGHPIATVWVNDVTPEGRLHRVARYILQSTKQPHLPGLEPKEAV